MHDSLKEHTSMMIDNIAVLGYPLAEAFRPGVESDGRISPLAIPNPDLNRTAVESVCFFVFSLCTRSRYWEPSIKQSITLS